MAALVSNSVCIDSSILIGFLRGQAEAIQLMRHAQSFDECCATAITVYEVMFGARRAKRNLDENALLSSFRILPLNNGSAVRAAQMHADMVRTNTQIGLNDIFIAAICIEHDMSLVTLNERHFERVHGLVLSKPEF